MKGGVLSTMGIDNIGYEKEIWEKPYANGNGYEESVATKNKEKNKLNSRNNESLDKEQSNQDTL
jgi:hypothetical protein